jgi:signal transduction histidine kinase
MKELIQLAQNLSFTNLDLLSVGITIAAIALLGFIVYMSNSKSVTNLSFLLFCAVTMLWSFFNYMSYQTKDPELALLLWKIVIFLACWHSFSFFNFLYVFPQEKIHFPIWYKYFLFPFITITSLWILFGNLVFSGVEVLNGTPEPVVEKSIILFVATVSVLIISSFTFLIRRISKAKKETRKPYQLLLLGAISTFFLLFTFNLILPAIFEVIIFIPLGALTILPFAVFTAYAVYKHKAFKVKNIGSTLMSFFLCSAVFVEVIFAQTPGQLVLRLGIFLFVLLISIQFVKNIFVLESITNSLEEANKKLAEANVKLQSLDKLKSEFISLASHQLRSPLTVIKGYASTLTDGVVGELEPKQREIVRHIYTAAHGLANVVEDFLNVTKIEQGGMKYEFGLVDVRQVTEDLASDMKIAAEDRGLTFESSIDKGSDYVIEGDGTKLKQVFLNLVDNSIKYTKAGFVRVTLSQSSVDMTMKFSVTDSGIGISDETKKKLFTKFGRGDGAAINGGGSGLGLYLAQAIVEAHHGRLEVSSLGEGKGATFSVFLPLHQSGKNK